MIKTNFDKKLQNCKVAPSLRGLSQSLGLEEKPLTGVQGQCPRKLPGFSHIKDQIIILSLLFFFSEDPLKVFFYFFVLPSVIFNWEQCSRAPVDFEALHVTLYEIAFLKQIKPKGCSFCFMINMIKNSKL